MKNIYKLSGLFTIAVVVSLCLAACIDPGNEEQDLSMGKPVHFAKDLAIKDEKVWELNYSTTRLSKVFREFDDNREITVEIPVFDPDAGIFNYITVAEGEIRNGILNVNIFELTDDKLLTGDELLNYFMEWHVGEDKEKGDKFDENIKINPKTVKGNQITLFTDEGDGLIEEGFLGTYTSLSSEYVYYLYVNENCTITAEKVENKDLKYTYNSFSLSLKKGWNTICKKETYTTEGNSSYSMEVKHPDLRWAMWRGVKPKFDVND